MNYNSRKKALAKVREDMRRKQKVGSTSQIIGASAPIQPFLENKKVRKLSDDEEEATNHQIHEYSHDEEVTEIDYGQENQNVSDDTHIHDDELDNNPSEIQFIIGKWMMDHTLYTFSNWQISLIVALVIIVALFTVISGGLPSIPLFDQGISSSTGL